MTDVTEVLVSNPDSTLAVTMGLLHAKGQAAHDWINRDHADALEALTPEPREGAKGERKPKKPYQALLTRLTLRYVAKKDVEARSGGAISAAIIALTAVEDNSPDNALKRWEDEAKNVFHAFMRDDDVTRGVGLLRVRSLVWSQYRDPEIRTDLADSTQKLDTHEAMWDEMYESFGLECANVTMLLRVLAGMLDGMAMDSVLRSTTDEAIEADAVAFGLSAAAVMSAFTVKP